MSTLLTKRGSSAQTATVDIDVVHPDLRAPLQRLPRLDPSKRSRRWLGRVGPKLLRAPAVPGVTISKVHDGGVRGILYRPATVASTSALLWVHGGGLVIGAPEQDAALCAHTAAELGIPVFAPRYRLAPEARFPEPLDDVQTAWVWLRANAAEFSADPAAVVIGGESAGAGLAAALVQRLHDTETVQPVAQWLFAPMLDDRTAARTELDGLNHFIWDNASNRFGWSSYLGDGPVADHAVPARRADLSGLPPTWLCTGDIELFHDEIADYAARLRSSGVEVELDVVPGGAHGFENWAWSAPVSQALMQRAWAWLRPRLTRAASRP